MALNIGQHGIVQRHDDGDVTLLRPGRNGGAGVEVEVSEELADAYRLATGDVIEGTCEAIDEVQSAAEASAEWYEHYELLEAEEQRDEPSAARGVSVPQWLAQRVVPSERLLSVTRVNGLSLEEAEDRPSPRKRNNAERSAPDRAIPLATGSADTTGRMLDFGGVLGAGSVGIIYGPHAGGLTCTLESVVAGACANAPDMVVIVLLLRARSEEVTEWRRRFKAVDVVVCPATASGATPEATLRVADLTLACVQRQTELGRHVLLAVDSLTGLWGAMLEAEHADAQTDADQSRARQTLREWVQKAGNFGGPGLLGNAIGGSLTLVGTVWQQSIDAEAEEERDLHPHLRLMEHLLHETAWRVPLSPILMRERLFPAIDTARCLSQREENLLSSERYERLLAARAAMAGMSLLERHRALLDALESTPDNDALLSLLAGDQIKIDVD
jgi:transcription termination factor Rho